MEPRSFNRGDLAEEKAVTLAYVNLLQWSHGFLTVETPPRFLWGLAGPHRPISSTSCLRENKWKRTGHEEGSHFS